MRAVSVDSSSARRVVRADGLHRWILLETQGGEPTVLLKQLLSDAAADSRLQQAWLRNVEVNRSLDHPCCTQVLETGVEDGCPFSASEYRPATSLQEIVRDLASPAAVVTPDLATFIAVEILSACEHAQQRDPDLIHLDLDPESIVIRTDGSVLVPEFGLWTVLAPAELTRRRFDSGRVPYSSPEVVRARVADTRSDVFSVGVMLFELLARSRPFAGDTQLAMAMSIAEGRRESLRKLVPDLSDGLAEIVEAMIAREPSERFQSPRAARQALASTMRSSAEQMRGALAALASQCKPLHATALAVSGARDRSVIATGSVPVRSDAPVAAHPPAAGAVAQDAAHAPFSVVEVVRSSIISSPPPWSPPPEPPSPGAGYQMSAMATRDLDAPVVPPPVWQPPDSSLAASLPEPVAPRAYPSIAPELQAAAPAPRAELAGSDARVAVAVSVTVAPPAMVPSPSPQSASGSNAPSAPSAPSASSGSSASRVSRAASAAEPAPPPLLMSSLGGLGESAPFASNAPPPAVSPAHLELPQPGDDPGLLVRDGKTAHLRRDSGSLLPSTGAPRSARFLAARALDGILKAKQGTGEAPSALPPPRSEPVMRSIARSSDYAASSDEASWSPLGKEQKWRDPSGTLFQQKNPLRQERVSTREKLPVHSIFALSAFLSFTGVVGMYFLYRLWQ